MAPCKGEWRLTSLQLHQAPSIEVPFRGHKGDQAQQGSVIVRTRDDASGDQAQQGSVIVRTRDDASGARSGVGAGGGAVALVV